jgi:hypothetical protein
MRVNKKITVSAALVAIGGVLLALGGAFGVLELSVGALASLLIVFACIELGSPYFYLVWLATSVISALIFPAGTVWGTYLLVFGPYPIIKGYIERLKRGFWLPLKLAFSAIATVALMILEELVLGIPLFNVDFVWLKYVMFFGAVLALLLFDYFLTVMIRVYLTKYRKMFSRLLK